eukprot:TRINITY_DN4192_c0_g1_i1.p1 TRINITY_DN4192_c0_g1~~TRINITY_DN4192_c0_g1_i1.p1  ORF type:complete len:244 (-),score=55.04 TRINITY_DN4192_c0_g1_i1:304-1035(-)
MQATKAKATKAKATNPTPKKVTRRKRKKKTGPPSWKTYLYKVLKQVHPDTGISVKAMLIADSYVHHLFDLIFREALACVEMMGKKVVTSRDIQTATRLVLPGELAKHAVSEGTKAVTKYISQNSKGGSKAAGLVFPVGRIKTFMKQKTHFNISGTTPVYMGAVMEYMCAEVLELAGNVARDSRVTRIIPRHFFLAVSNDEELGKLLLRRVIIPGAGVVPHIHVCLLPPQNKTSTGGTQDIEEF